MEDIKKYLEKQLELSKELGDILNQINTLDEETKKILYVENEDIVSKLNSANKENVVLTQDRIDRLSQRLETLLLDNDVCNNLVTKNKLLTFNKDLYFISNKINRMDNEVNLIMKKHEETMLAPNKVELDSTKIENCGTSLTNGETILTENKNISIDKKTNDSINNEVKKDRDKKTYNDIQNYNNSKFEFNMGSNLLSLMGIILILISVIIFGKHIYTNYLTNTLKGICLFIISSLILVLGEKILVKKVPKFALGISALGIGCLYVSLVTNYLILNTINSIVAIILTVIITGISLFISSNKESDIIRIIALLGGYGCLVPINDLNTIQSYITVFILLSIGASNIYLPIKTNKFLLYSSLFNVLFCLIIVESDCLMNYASEVYRLCTIALNSYLYIKLCNSDYKKTYLHLSFWTTFLLAIFSTLFIKELLIGEIATILILLASSYFVNNKLKGSFYSNCIFAVLCIISNYHYEIGELFVVPYSLLFIAIVFLTIKYKDCYCKFTSVILAIVGCVIISDFIKWYESLIYIVVLSSVLWWVSKEYKDNLLVIVFKYLLAYTIITWCSILTQNGLSELYMSIYAINTYEMLLLKTLKTLIYNEYIIMCLFSVIYVLIISNVERLQHKSVKRGNSIILVISFIAISLLVLDFFDVNIIKNIILLSLCALILLLLTNPKYTSIEFIQKHSILSYSIYSTYVLWILSMSSSLNNGITNLLFSISLMILAFINVWLGFKLNILGVRRYGLILSLVVCAKLILVDLYTYNFVVKAGLFLVIGIVALTISYIYSKLEQELKNNENNNDNKEI